MKELRDYQVLSFDCYGTLIDWEAGLAQVLNAWAADVGLDTEGERLLTTYASHEAAVMGERPGDLYPQLLAEALRRVGTELGKPVSDQWADRIAESVPQWPAFSDSAEALRKLGRRYDLIILSNVHRAGFQGSNRHLQGEYAQIITAEDVGAYKPAQPHFDALDEWLQHHQVAREDLLHVAQSLFHDHVPAHQNGVDSVWINRRHDQPGWGATPEPAQEWNYHAEYTSMREFVEAVERSFGAMDQEA